MFRHRRIIQLVCSVTLLVALALAGHGSGSHALAQGNGNVASVSGHGFFPGSNGEPVIFSYSAHKHADGTVKGRYEYDIQSLDARFEGPITCLTVRDNRAWVGGIAETVESTNPNLAALEGQEMWFQAQDNGESANDPPDITTSIGVTPVGGPLGQAEAYCEAMPDPRFPQIVHEGNIQVRDKQ